MKEQTLSLAFLGPVGKWDPSWRPSRPQEKRGRRKTRMKRRCSVMPAHGPTAPPQMSKSGLREDAEQSRRREEVAGQGSQSFADLLVGKAGWASGKAERIGGF